MPGEKENARRDRERKGMLGVRERERERKKEEEGK